MTYRQIIRELYTQNKLFIRVYLGAALLVSVFFFHAGGISFASGEVVLSEAENTVLGGSFSTVFLVAANNANIPISPSVALSCSALLSIWGEYGTLPQQLQNFSFGLMDTWFFRIFAFVWAAVSILPRCSQITRIGGLVIEDVEQKMGQIATFFVAFSQLAANLNGGMIANAAGADSVVKTGTAFLNIFLSFVVLVALLTCFLFIRTFMFFIDIIQLPICTLIPFTSAVSETVKVAGVVIMYALAIFAPGVYIACYGFLLFLSILFFKKAYLSVRYFKHIYVKPFFKKIKGYDKDITLIHPKAPKSITRELSGTDTRLLIPVYAAQKTALYPAVKRHDKWWLAVNSTGCHLYQYKPFKKQLHHLRLVTGEHKTFFSKNSLRFFELFSLAENINSGKAFRKIRKEWHFVYSNEYTHRYPEISAILGSTDYNQYTAEHKGELKRNKKSFGKRKEKT